VPSNLKEVAEVMAFLSAVHPGFEMTTDTIRAYHVLLCDIEPGLLMAAAIHLSASSKWFPKASELREASLDMALGEDGPPNAEEAWAEVVGEVRRIGSYGTPDFSHESVGLAVEGIGGWGTLCRSDNIVADRAHYMKVYAGLCKASRERTLRHPALTGLVERMRLDGGNGRRALPPGKVIEEVTGEDEPLVRSADKERDSEGVDYSF
jgi:hypothetical protein